MPLSTGPDATGLDANDAEAEDSGIVIRYRLGVHEEVAVRSMNANELPTFRVELVPTEGMRSVGIQKQIFIKLWTIAGSWPESVYEKSDWRQLDQILFASERTENEKRRLVELITRLWVTASQYPRYDEDEWRTLRKLIQEPTYG